MSAGGSSGSGDTRFSREGTVNTSSWRSLTPEHNAYFTTGFSKLDDGLASQALQPMLIDRMQRGWGGVPYSDAICQVVKANLPGNKVPGQASLQGQAAIDPYSSQYADNTYARYSQDVHKMLANTRSGPAASRGGTAAQGFMQSDALNQMALNREDVLARNRQTDAGIQQSAAGQLGQQRGRMDQTALSGTGTGFQGFFNLLQDQGNAGQLASDRTKAFAELVPSWVSLASVMQGLESNNLSGRGSQTSSSMGAGINLCCFIFLEAYDGVLPESVRKYRDMVAPENSARRKGYIRMSRWLVPAMRVNGFSRELARHLLTKPLRAYGEWYYGNNKWGWVFWPLKQVWFKVWEQLGKH